MVLCYCENKAAVEPRRDAAAETSRNAAVEALRNAAVETHRDAAVETRESPQNEVKVETVSLRFLKLAGVVPLLSLASHAHYILIAWITDPAYATGIGINYVIFYVIYLVEFKHTYIGIKEIKDSRLESLNENVQKIVHCCIAVLLMVIAWLISVSLQVLLSVLFVYIPINNSIEDTCAPSTLRTHHHTRYRCSVSWLDHM